MGGSFWGLQFPKPTRSIRAVLNLFSFRVLGVVLMSLRRLTRGGSDTGGRPRMLGRKEREMGRDGAKRRGNLPPLPLVAYVLSSIQHLLPSTATVTLRNAVSPSFTATAVLHCRILKLPQLHITAMFSCHIFERPQSHTAAVLNDRSHALPQFLATAVKCCRNCR